MTTLGKLEVSEEVISKVLNHTNRGPRATAIYARYDYDREKRTALEAWGSGARRQGQRCSYPRTARIESVKIATVRSSWSSVMTAGGASR